ncbi:zinc finger protein 574 [Gadus morhua]|uniref:zinc finger protein 574 n=1 Tax=Gadus morhua TaxID=8049 RepID=UPI0011B773D2|nr:zinc finger protein 624-like [Gadus morhua]XP_030226554.1 zinc finger protein 624-like [Gadus morhua]XP_030226555.1 zinc finger protein 624-like [Gadus morhua]XP_030226556.1 zinc finger protein 624-like [Gadus morhua]
MESATSVYMCFPCYQEFETLEEVLKHQLTCNAEATEPAPDMSGLASIAVQQTQQQVVGHLLAPETTQHITSKEEEEAAAAAAEEEASVWETKDGTEQDASSDVPSTQSNQPRILYQCGDCNELFKTLEQWQGHRLDELCHQPGVQAPPQAEPEPEPEPEGANASEEEAAEAQGADEETQQEAILGKQAAASSTQDDSPSRRRGANKKPKPEAVFLCVDCGSGFGLVSELVAHRKSQHGLEEALHRCSVCGECFLNTTLFLYHRKQHRQKGEEKGEVPQNAVVHVPRGNGDAEEEQAPTVVLPAPSSSSPSASGGFTQPEAFMCTLCGGNFRNVGGLSAHRKEKHGLKDALHLCVECGQEFMNTTQFLYHRRQHRVQQVMVPEAGDGAEVVVAEDGGHVTVEGEEIEMEEGVENPQGQKRPYSPAITTDPESPRPKRGRPAIRILSKNAPLKAMKGVGTGAIKVEPPDPEAANQPPPAKLLQDWARTPLPHVCPYCGKTFTRRVFLRTHVFSHTGEKLFTCKVCSKCFTNSQSLLRHSMCHTGNKPYICDECGKKFSQVCTLKRHQATHSSNQPRRKRGRKPICGLEDDGTAHVFPCPHCTARFNTEDQLKHHILLHSSHPFPCTVCGEAFKRRRELDLHALSHQDKEPVTCIHCSAQFVNQSVLDIHLQRCPTSEEDKNVGRGRGQGRGRCTGQMECDLCGHRCMTQEGLDLHRLSHTGQTPLKCPVLGCRRRFASNAALEEHMLAHIQGTLSRSRHRPRFRCDICLKEFAYTSTFNVHMRTHTDERPFECATCGKRFRQLPHLQDHERIHSGLRPFCCWVCGKSFSVAARLTEHARTHSGEKPYACIHCPAAFRSRSNLDKHVRLHGDLPHEGAGSATDAAAVAQVLEGAEVLTSLAGALEGEVGGGGVQTFYVLQEEGAGGTETVMISSEQLAAMDGSSQMVILPSSVLGGGQTIALPHHLAMDGGEIMVHTGVSPSQQHTIEFIVEETVV